MHLNTQKKVFAGQVENTKIDKKGKLLDNWQKYLKNTIGQENKKKKKERNITVSVTKERESIAISMKRQQ